MVVEIEGAEVYEEAAAEEGAALTVLGDRLLPGQLEISGPHAMTVIVVVSMIISKLPCVRAVAAKIPRPTMIFEERIVKMGNGN
jgi:hypothetical protein